MGAVFCVVTFSVC